MKNIYSFILGHSPEISFAEILCVLNSEKIEYSIVEFNKIFLLLNIEEKIDADLMIQRLGGSIAIGKVEFQFNGSVDTESMFDVFLTYIQNNINDKKIKIGFSLYNFDAKLTKSIKNNSFELKRKLKELGVSVRIVTSKKDELSAVIIKKEKLLTSGMAFQLLKFEKGIMFSKTLSVFDFEKYNEIDYGRPGVDAKSGMMPPKLSKIMINISQEKECIYDPFCGSGTILLMGAELGTNKLIGSDISKRAVSDSEENIKWYEETYNKKLDYSIFESDFRQLIKHDEASGKDFSVVTEGYLGEPLRGNEGLVFIMNQKHLLEKMYLDFFMDIKQFLGHEKSVVITFPVFCFNKNMYYLQIQDKIEKLGFEMIKLLDDKYLSERGTLIYKRDDQRVYREIIKFVKL